MLPSLGLLRSTTERFQKLTSKLEMSSNFLGCLKLQCLTPSAEIVTEFHGLINPKPADSENDKDIAEKCRQEQPEAWAKVMVETKDLVRLLHWYVAIFQPKHA
jgi:hypothetical protein